MDEGLRLARMVSHDRAGKLTLGSEGAHLTGDFLKTVLPVWCELLKLTKKILLGSYA